MSTALITGASKGIGLALATALGQAGARVVLPNKSTALAKLFAGSQWYAEGGAAGGWAQAMRRLKGAKAEKSSRFGGRGWSVPVHVFLQSDLEIGEEA
jgi:NAD(P)-dependent dehydrogenase (short-subunit alcohol dehydrogenase family)